MPCCLNGMNRLKPQKKIIKEEAGIFPPLLAKEIEVDLSNCKYEKKLNQGYRTFFYVLEDYLTINNEKSKVIIRLGFVRRGHFCNSTL